MSTPEELEFPQDNSWTVIEEDGGLFLQSEITENGVSRLLTISIGDGLEDPELRELRVSVSELQKDQYGVDASHVRTLVFRKQGEEYIFADDSNEYLSKENDPIIIKQESVDTLLPKLTTSICVTQTEALDTLGILLVASEHMVGSQPKLTESKRDFLRDPFAPLNPVARFWYEITHKIPKELQGQWFSINGLKYFVRADGKLIQEIIIDYPNNVLVIIDDPKEVEFVMVEYSRSECGWVLNQPDDKGIYRRRNSEDLLITFNHFVQGFPFCIQDTVSQPNASRSPNPFCSISVLHDPEL